MDSLDAECLLMTVASDGGCAPVHWCHRDDGSLACHYADSANELTWPAPAIAEIAEKWRERSDRESPPEIERLVSAHRTFASLLAEAELDPPEAIVHDLQTAEVRARWTDQKLEVVVEAFDRVDESHPDAQARAS